MATKVYQADGIDGACTKGKRTTTRPKARQVAAYAGSGGVLLNPSPEQGRKQDEELRQHGQAKAASKGRTEDLSHRPESDFGGSNSRTAGAGSTAVCFQTDGQRKEKGDSGRAVKEEAKDRSHQNQRRPRRSPDYPLNPRPSQGKNIHQTAITGARTSTRMGGWESQEDEGAQQDAVADYF
jgi:hypothetical protein